MGGDGHGIFGQRQAAEKSGRLGKAESAELHAQRIPRRVSWVGCDELAETQMVVGQRGQFVDCVTRSAKGRCTFVSEHLFVTGESAVSRKS